MSAAAKRLSLLAVLLAASCGYSVGGLRAGAAPPHIIVVARIDGAETDVDAAADVGRALRLALARGPETSIDAAEPPDAIVRVEILEAGSRLGAFAEPAYRAVKYQATIRLQAQVEEPRTGRSWRTPVVSGRSSYLSTPGPIERLDGAGRAALRRAAEDAVDRLIVMLKVELEAR